MLKDLRAHFRGCLLGLAVGDALGGPVEFMDSNAIEKKHGRVTEMLGGGWLKLKVGETTDDTQMTLCLAQSLVEEDAFVPDDIAARFVAWLESSPPDVGNHTRAVLSKIAGGSDWKSATTNVQRATPQSAGNGSLMRCAPVALFDYADTSRRIEHSRIQSEITHAHQECQWSCALLNSFIFNLIDCGVRDVALDRALNECRDAPGHIRKRASLAAGRMRSELKPTGYVLDTLDCAIWAFMNTESFEDAVVSAINLGGDADTNGAVCGAIAGAFYGERQIPNRWLEVLHGRLVLAELATQLALRHIPAYTPESKAPVPPRVELAATLPTEPPSAVELDPATGVDLEAIPESGLDPDLQIAPEPSVPDGPVLPTEAAATDPADPTPSVTTNPAYHKVIHDGPLEEEVEILKEEFPDLEDFELPKFGQRSQSSAPPAADEATVAEPAVDEPTVDDHEPPITDS